MASAHHLSSFNNEVYLASVRDTRAFAMERDGNVNASRFCAGCHDVVPFFSGKFNDPDYDMQNDPTAHAGITCTVCHAISAINSPRGNSDYTIDTPIHYPFAFSENPALRWINEQLVKAKPEFHKKTFLKPLHQSTEFCGTCHKVHLPEELNDLAARPGPPDVLPAVGDGQHRLLPPGPRRTATGATCRWSSRGLRRARARRRPDEDLRSPFPSASTVPLLAAEDDLVTQEQADRAVEAHRRFNEGVMRVDIFGLREGGEISGELHAPLRPEVPALTPGERYLLEVVVRTVKMGHHFTQGTSDSNQVWMELTAEDGRGETLGRSGWMDPARRSRSLEPLPQLLRPGRGGQPDRSPERSGHLHRALQPPDPARGREAIRYALQVPEDAVGPVTVTARLRYRKFDTEIMQYVLETPTANDLPVIELAQDSVFPVGNTEPAIVEAPGSRSGSAGTTTASGCFKPGGAQLNRPRRPSRRSRPSAVRTAR